MTAELHLVGSDDRRAPAPSATCLLGDVVNFPTDAPGAMTSLTEHGLLEHTAVFGPRPRTLGSAGRVLVDTLDVIGLSGRGGSHFPAAAKWRTHLAAGGGGVVVANGAESEPASGKDRALLQLRPHLVLDGIACAAEAVGARDAVIWLHGGDAAARSAVGRALVERRAAGLAEPDIRVVVGPNRYLSGESSAIVSALSGGRALPTFRTQPAAVSGVDGQPTLIHNVETLARTALAARTGAEWHAGTTLLTIAGERGRTVIEVAPETLLGAVLTEWAATDGRPPQAVLVGGYGGTWLAWEDIAALPADELGMRRHGRSLGAGVLLTVPADTCGLVAVADISYYLAANSARQCGPCVFGLRAVSDVLAELAESDSGRRDMRRLQRFLAEISGRGACGHPDGAVRMVASALDVFAEDVQCHLRRGRCRHPRVGEFFPTPDCV
ncbi:MAG: NADH:ubiquinone oxidoreductase, NADH-binding (51 kD) subunit [Pseudonocardiales bacterium]|nr:NADH:ubiquinone oxidoreductase, NADH-binding (51 kD) subunit [Pseudonocardiales bacterium]